MTSPIFIDTNIPMYAAGRPHALRQPCLDILSFVARHPGAFITDVEVFQELLHRYTAIGAWHQLGRPVFGSFAMLMRGRVELVSFVDVESAASLADQHAGLSGRDLLHAAVMLRVGAMTLISADRDFDTLPAFVRLDPGTFHAWRGQLPT
jgi:uncharacterized protein